MSHALVGKHPLVTGGGTCKAAIIVKARARPSPAMPASPSWAAWVQRFRGYRLKKINL